MADEKGYIIHAFQRNFQSRKSEKICLYGTGRNTWELLNDLKEYNIRTFVVETLGELLRAELVLHKVSVFRQKTGSDGSFASIF